MSTTRKLGATFAALALAVGASLGTVALGAGAADASRPGVHARSVLPAVGHYQGRDGHNRHITFSYDGHAIHNVRANGHLLVTRASVSGAQVHHTCDHSTRKCVRGHWFNDHTFQGTWNDPNQGHESYFQAHYIP
ncbi:hypothetical protein [Nocardioides sp.]|uniref:hypothetical protein n=1 Tax=Nocardioides sp. TaxID=35761 RepID=UPI003784EA6E